MMNLTDHVLKDVLFALVKEWQELQRRLKRLEYELLLYFRKVRETFTSGSVGDRHFKDFCVDHLKMEEAEADLRLTQAIAARVYKDENELKEARVTTTQFLLLNGAPKAEREQVMRTAKSEGVRIAHVWRREKWQPKKPSLATKSQLAQMAINSTVAADEIEKDTRRLAALIRNHVKDLTVLSKADQRLVARYTERKLKAS